MVTHAPAARVSDRRVVCLMAFSFSQRSLDNLKGVHPDLVRVVTAALAITPVDFGIIEGMRTLDRQKMLFATGKSQTMNSRHLHGMAVDFAAFVDGIVSWEPNLYGQIATAMKKAASDLGIPVHWGGDWVTFKDGDHLELDRIAYPDPPSAPLVA